MDWENPGTLCATTATGAGEGITEGEDRSDRSAKREEDAKGKSQSQGQEREIRQRGDSEEAGWTQDGCSGGFTVQRWVRRRRLRAGTAPDGDGLGERGMESRADGQGQGQLEEGSTLWPPKSLLGDIFLHQHFEKSKA